MLRACDLMPNWGHSRFENGSGTPFLEGDSPRKLIYSQALRMTHRCICDGPLEVTLPASVRHGERSMEGWRSRGSDSYSSESPSETGARSFRYLFCRSAGCVTEEDRSAMSKDDSRIGGSRNPIS